MAIATTPKHLHRNTTDAELASAKKGDAVSFYDTDKKKQRHRHGIIRTCKRNGSFVVQAGGDGRRFTVEKKFVTDWFPAEKTVDKVGTLS